MFQPPVHSQTTEINDVPNTDYIFINLYQNVYSQICVMRYDMDYFILNKVSFLILRLFKSNNHMKLLPKNQ